MENLLTTILKEKMQIKDKLSFKNGEEYLKKNHPRELEDIYESVEKIDITEALSKVSHEKNKQSLLFSPINMNAQLKKELLKKDWNEKRINFDDDSPAFREIDGIKNKVGLEIQFGKYAFMAYDIFSKMPIFKKRNLINCGIELVLCQSMIKHMSTGVSSFRQIELDINARGVSELDIPTFILGFECTNEDWKLVKKIRDNFKVGRKVKAVNLKGNKPGPKK